MSDLRKRFGNRLKRLRKRRGLTQKQLAEAVGLSVDFVGLVERGLRAPSFDSLERLAQILQISVAGMFDSEGESHEQ